jgi:hypothetical protein
MVDSVTTKDIPVSSTTVARHGYWRGVFAVCCAIRVAYSSGRLFWCC